MIEAVPDGPAAAAAIEARAWEETWQNVDRDLREELRTLREGTRPLEDLRRLRQYMRMLDAIERAPVEEQEQAARARVVRRRAFGGLALAAAAAAIAVFLTSAPLRVADQVPNAPVPSPATATRSTPPAAPPQTGAAAEQTTPRVAGSQPPSTGVPKAGAGAVRQPASTTPRLSSGSRTVAATSARAPLTGYAVGFGEFATRTTAEARMRLIRAKGYLVYVAQVGDSYLVVTRPYRTREQADRMSNALQEIGLPATTQIAGTFLL